MKTLLINRPWHFPQSCLGELLLPDGKHFGFTLEDTVRGWGIKVRKNTAIPATGDITYKIGITFSAKFNRYVLVIYTHEESGRYFVNHGGIQFEAIYFHGLNDHTETEGCIGIARTQNLTNGTIQGTLEKELFTLVKSWLDAGHEVILKIVNQKNLLQ